MNTFLAIQRALARASTKQILVSSGLLEITFAVMLGWILAAFLIGKRAQVGPFHSMKRVLQAHIDYIFMGCLQIAIGCAVASSSDPNSSSSSNNNNDIISSTTLVLLIVGSWTNATLFLLAAVTSVKQQRSPASIALMLASFVTLSLAYVRLSFEYISSWLSL